MYYYYSNSFNGFINNIVIGDLYIEFEVEWTESNDGNNIIGNIFNRKTSNSASNNFSSPITSAATSTATNTAN